jgi:hypothetical protein
MNLSGDLAVPGKLTNQPSNSKTDAMCQKGKKSAAASEFCRKNKGFKNIG